MAPASRILLVAFLLATASTMVVAAPAKAKPPPAAPAADAPSAATDDRKPPMVVDPITVLNRDGKFTTFVDLLKQSRVDKQIMAQLTDGKTGLTIVAPTEAAFDDLKAGTFNGLSNNDFVQMILYCVLPRFYPAPMLSTLSGKLNTEASGPAGPYKYNIMTSGNNISFSTGVKGNSMLLHDCWEEFPIAVYYVDKVPLPYELFGPQPPTSAPAPTKSKHKKKKSAEAPDYQDPDDTKNAASSSLTGRWVATLGVLAAAVFVFR